MKISLHTLRNKGYTLVEALMASALLGAMIGGAVALVGTMNLQERTAISGTVGAQHADCAARLWQFGLSPTEVLSPCCPPIPNNEFVDRTILVSGTNAVDLRQSPTTTTLSSKAWARPKTLPCTVTLMEDPQNTNNRTVTAQVCTRPALAIIAPFPASRHPPSATMLKKVCITNIHTGSAHETYVDTDSHEKALIGSGVAPSNETAGD